MEDPRGLQNPGRVTRWESPGFPNTCVEEGSYQPALDYGGNQPLLSSAPKISELFVTAATFLNPTDAMTDCVYEV